LVTDDSITALLFGQVQRLVGALYHPDGVGDIGVRDRGHTSADSYLKVLAVFVEFLVLDRQPDAFRSLASAGSRGMVEDYGELLTAIASCHVTVTNDLFDQAPDALEYVITDFVPVGIVAALEEIDIE